MEVDQARGSTRLSRRVVASYAAGSVGTGGFGVLPGLVLAFYLTDTLAVSAAVASAVVLVPKIVDVLVNPVIGARSDAVAQRSGRARFMAAGTVLLPPLFVLTFAVPSGAGPGVGAVWVLVSFTLTAVAYSLFQVPYIALPAELTGDYHERTRLVSTRIAALALAILLVGAGGPAVRDAFGGGSGGYLVMAVAAALVVGAGMAVATLGAGRQARIITTSSGEASFTDAFAALGTSRRYRVLLAVYVLQALASAVMLAGAQYLAVYVLDSDGALTILFAALVAPAMLVMPLWYRWGRRHGKLRGLAASSVLFMLASVAMAAAIWVPGPWMFGAVAVAGVGYAGMQAFPLALLPDVIDEDAVAAGRDRGGALSGLWTAAETVGLALGPALFLLVLAATGFVSSSGDHHVHQSTAATTGIAAGFSLLPAALVAASLAVLRGFGPDPGSVTT